MKPRQRFTISPAGAAQSIRPSSFLSFRASVTPAGSCGTGRAVPVRSASSAASSSSAPFAASRASSSGADSSGRTGVRQHSRMSPASISGVTKSTHTPVSASPFASVHWMGLAPRYLGSSDGCTFSVPHRGTASSGRLRNCPKSATTTTSGSSRAMASTISGDDTASDSIGTIPSSAAARFTLHGSSFFPRPPGRSGCTTTPASTTRSDPCSARSSGHARSPAPSNTTLVFSSMPPPYHAPPPSPSPRPEPLLRLQETT